MRTIIEKINIYRRWRMFLKDSSKSAKGDYGEELVIKLLNDKGCKVKEHYSHDSSHLIDTLVLGSSFNYFYAEIKTKSHRTYYNDTGCNINAYKGYKKCEKKHPVWMFFVDEKAGWIYGQSLSILDKSEGCYPLEVEGYIYFPLSKMIKFIKLTEDEIEKLKDFTFK